jgi:hypothetical protein
MYFFFLTFQNGKRVSCLLANDTTGRRTVVQYNSCYILGKMTFRTLNVTLQNTTLYMGSDLSGTDARQVVYKTPLFTAMSVLTLLIRNLGKYVAYRMHKWSFLFAA